MHEHAHPERELRRRYRRPRPAISYEDLLTKAKRITKEDAKRLIDEGKNPLFLDVRTRRAFEEGEVKIKGAAWIPPSQLHEVIGKLPEDRPIVTY